MSDDKDDTDDKRESRTKILERCFHLIRMMPDDVLAEVEEELTTR